MGSTAIQQGIAPPPGAPLIGNVAYIPPGFEGLYLKPFTYTVIMLNAGTGVTTATTQIQNDSYFVVTEQFADIWDAASGNTTQIQPVNFPGAVRVLDTSSGGYMMDQPVPIGSYFGTAIQPFVWLYRAMVYLPGGQLQVEFTSRSAVAQRITFSFTGFKVYDMEDLRVNTRNGQ